MACHPDPIQLASLVVFRGTLLDDVYADSWAKSPGLNIDVYLQPLIDELIELWVKGVETWDEDKKEKFTLHALLLWTINDFPAYAMLSGWSTKGKFACPYCHKDTEYLWLKFGLKHCYMGHLRFLPQNHRWHKCKGSFNNMTEMRKAPVALTGPQALQQYSSFEQPKFRTASKKGSNEKKTLDGTTGGRRVYLSASLLGKLAYKAQLGCYAHREKCL
jgi:hypothetical protein